MNNETILREKLSFKGGLGPIQAENQLEIEIRPLTIFIGPQGTGKSLASQLLYFSRDAQYLLATYSGAQTYKDAVRKVIEGLRTGDLSDRPLASFLTTATTRITHISETGTKREFAIRNSKNEIAPIFTFKNEVKKWFDGWLSGTVRRSYTPRALFIPAERMFFSRFINTEPGIMGRPALPYSMQEFSNVLTRSGGIYQAWKKEPEQARFIEHLVHRELRGKIHYSRKGPKSGKWQWELDNNRFLEIEMASSGQMEVWPLVFTAQTLFGMKPEQRPLYLHIEEPEAHLHPRAQVAIAKMIAYLINNGFRIVITTHSLTILYALNNLSLAYQKIGPTEKKERVPDPQTRLNPNLISAYLFDGKTPVNIIDKNGQIDEGQLGEVLGNLETEFNRILAYKRLWE